jgi:predicted GIY-YIG superfamily endonuclease
MYWSSKDISKLKSFILSQKNILIPIFYQNILSGSIKTRKPSGFFTKMSTYLGRTTDQCKSKFQKFEKEIYTKYLKVPNKDFFVFLWMQKNKDINTKVEDFLKNKTDPAKESSKIENYSQFHDSIQIKEIPSRNSNGNAFESDQDHFEKSSSASQFDDNNSSSSEDQSEEDLIRHWLKIVDNIKNNKQVKDILSNIDLEIKLN